jgi:hypothetical protein
MCDAAAIRKCSIEGSFMSFIISGYFLLANGMELMRNGAIIG